MSVPGDCTLSIDMLTRVSIASELHQAIMTARAGEVRLGLSIAQRAWREAVATESPHGRMHALNAVSICQAASGNYIESLAAGIDAWRLADDLHDPHACARAQCAVAGASVFIFDTSDQAMALLDECLQAARQLNDATLDVLTRNARGVARLKQLRYDDSLGEYKTALARVAETDGTLPRPLIVCNIAAVHMRRAATATGATRAQLQQHAQIAIDWAIALASVEKNREAASRGYYSQAALCVQREDLVGALVAYRHSLQLAQELRHPYRIANVQMEMGDVYAQLDQLDCAQTSLEAALQASASRRPNAELATIGEKLAAVYERKGDSHAAAHHRAQAIHEREAYRRECESATRQLATQLAGIWQPCSLTAA